MSRADDELPNYIAAGCLVFDQVNADELDCLEPSLHPSQWLHFSTSPQLSRALRDAGDTALNLTEAPLLPPDLERRLLLSARLAPFSELWKAGWIHLSFRMSLKGAKKGIARVYLLRDDAGNRHIPRRIPPLRKARLLLLRQLDFSAEVWNGDIDTNSSHLRLPSMLAPVGSAPGEEGPSLLQMFNTIPSPDPQPGVVEDPEARSSMCQLMESRVPGLCTTLYLYQRRSAALMLQREAQIDKIPDPRLCKLRDQYGLPWYYDTITGSSLREPRYYDSPSGGILAEEMGSGKTLICLALILATKHIPAFIPDIYRSAEPPVRPKVGSLADMAAACITRNSVPWRRLFSDFESDGMYFPHLRAAIQRNHAFYDIDPPLPRRQGGRPRDLALNEPIRVYLSHTSLVVVPANLVQQWQQEIVKHTSGLNVLVIDQKAVLPTVEKLLEYDILLFSTSQFESLYSLALDGPEGRYTLDSPLAHIHFKRCIVDEGHRLGNSTAHNRSNLHLVVDCLRVTSRWIVTGTPSKGLYGDSTDAGDELTDDPDRETPHRPRKPSHILEKEDLKRIGSIASLYLKVRPWANQGTEVGDIPADWVSYVTKSRDAGRRDCLRATLDSLIVRHRMADIGSLLPTVDENFVYLDGSYQDILVLNIFSMMIIFNAVQSQRTDQDYFFHPRQRKALIQLVSNLRQASFFGGIFFPPDQIAKSIETAEKFLEEGKVRISDQDDELLRRAIAFGKLALENNIKKLASTFNELPIFLEKFPWGAGEGWSLDGQGGDLVCTDSRLTLALQHLLQPLVDAPNSLQLLFSSGRFTERGRQERAKGIEHKYGNTEVGQDKSKKQQSAVNKGADSLASEANNGVKPPGTEVAAALADTRLVSTASAKLSYLLDQIVKYQDDEQIIIFYENDNVAYYLAGALEILQIHHLIYAKGLTPKRRAQYVATFNQNPKFRVLLMDITQAAFGLDMRSASRVYFINPVLNPQVEAQAIGRARRISQKKPVTVETLVLRNSVEEVIVKRRGEMTQAEQWKCRSILDDKPIYEWIINAKIHPLPGGDELAGPEQMAKLRSPQFIFGRDFGRQLSNPDQDLVMNDGTANAGGASTQMSIGGAGGGGPKVLKRPESQPPTTRLVRPVPDGDDPPRKKPRVRFADSDDDKKD